jgi:hypothetical protein
MNSVNLSPLALRALSALQEQLALLMSLTGSDTEDPRFIKWHLTTTEVFKRFLPDSNYRSKFVNTHFSTAGYFDPPYPKSDPRNPFNRGCVAVKVYLEAAIENIQRYGLDTHDAIPEAAAQAVYQF